MAENLAAGELMIVIEWEGPHTVPDLLKSFDQGTMGIYQVYAHHPVYGCGLVYIGLTRDDFFRRLDRSDWDRGSENDPENVRIYVGKLLGDPSVALPKDEWRRRIGLAEKLLIHAHGPAYNTQHIKDIASPEDVRNVRVINRGKIRSLHREVSGLVWTNASEIFNNWTSYGEAE